LRGQVSQNYRIALTGDQPLDHRPPRHTQGAGHLHLLGRPTLARQWLDALIADCRAGTGPEVRGMARTLMRWSEAILAWHTTG
jgi:hypothetical protein